MPVIKNKSTKDQTNRTEHLSKQELKARQKQLDEINRMLDYLHDKRDWVSLNTLRYKFPWASKQHDVFDRNGISKKVVKKNTYHCFNRHVKWWRPLRDCQFYDRCSCNICLLDQDVNLRNKLEDDEECLFISKNLDRCPTNI